MSNQTAAATSQPPASKADLLKKLREAGPAPASKPEDPDDQDDKVEKPAPITGAY